MRSAYRISLLIILSLLCSLAALAQVRHWEGQKRVKSFEISLGYGRVCTTFLNLERL